MYHGGRAYSMPKIKKYKNWLITVRKLVAADLELKGRKLQVAEMRMFT